MKHMMFRLDDRPLEEQIEAVSAQWRTGKWKKVLFHLYSAFPEEEKLVGLCGEILALFPEAVVVGTMSAGEIMHGELMEPGTLVSALLFEKTDIRLLRYDGVKGREKETGRALREALDAIPDLAGAELLFPGTSVSTEPLYDELSLCRKGVAIFCGYPGGHQLNSPDHFIYDSEGTYYDAMLVVAYIGKDLHFDTDKTVGWDALGLPFKVTKAEGNHLIELDGKPAADVYEKFLHIDRKLHNNAEDAFEFPLLAKKDGDERLRSTVHIEEDGSVYLHGFVTEGMDIYLSYGNPAHIVERADERLTALRRFRPQAILMYSCVVRKTFWEDFVNMEMQPFEQLAPTGGFHTWGEVLRIPETGEVAENNITLLTIGMREGPLPKEEMPEVHVEDSLLKGQASLLKRLSKLVHASTEELQKAHSRMEEMNRKLTVLAERDGLTGIYNRRIIEQHIDEALEKTAATGEPLSLIMLDIDDFKQVNDRYGHQTGDAVLINFANILLDFIRKHKGFETGRWGGEEFFLVLPGTDAATALHLAEELRKTIAEFPFATTWRLTSSFGLFTVNGPCDPREAYKKVDDALYKAKADGKNRVYVARD